MNKFRKIFHHIKSDRIDEKIKSLDKEMERTGMVLGEGTMPMSTSNVYKIYDYAATPAVDQETSTVPDSTGFADGGSQNANGGDENDPDTWDDGWNNTTDMSNPNELNGETDRPIPITPDLSGWDGSSVSANNLGSGGYRGIAAWTISSGIGGGLSVGTIDSGNHHIGILVPSNINSTYNYPTDQSGHLSGGYYGSYSNTEFAAAQNIASAYEAHKVSGSVQRKVWVNYDQATSSGGPSYADYTGAKKQTTNASNGQPLYWKLKDVSILSYVNPYTSQDATPEIFSHVLDREYGLGSDYYPGDVGGFLDWLKGKLELSDQAWEKLKEELEKRAGGLPYGTPGADDPFDHDDLDDDDLLDDSDFDMSDWEFAFAEIEDDMKKDSSSDSSPFDEPASDANTGWVNPGDEVAWGGGKSKEEKALEKKFNYWNNTAKYNNKQKGDNAAAMIQMGMGIPVDSFTQTFGITPTEWQNPANWLPDGKPNPNGPGWNKYKNEKYEPEGTLISEGWESPKHTYVDKNQQKRWFKEKDVVPVYPKKAPPKMVNGYHPKMLPKLDTPIPYIKVKRKDLMRAHKLKKYEAQQYVDLVDKLNDYIMRNPNMLAYVRERYPKSDPHLAALNYKMDMQIAASDEYIETRFPENKRLYDKLMQATKRSIDLTDPKTFKSRKGKMTSINKLMRVDYVMSEYDPTDKEVKNKRIKSNKKSIGRFFKKPKKKTKGDILKDKMAVLDKEMKKTMPEG